MIKTITHGLFTLRFSTSDTTIDPTFYIKDRFLYALGWHGLFGYDYSKVLILLKSKVNHFNTNGIYLNEEFHYLFRKPGKDILKEEYQSILVEQNLKEVEFFEMFKNFFLTFILMNSKIVVL